jgi:hypothetical protein
MGERERERGWVRFAFTKVGSSLVFQFSSELAVKVGDCCTDVYKYFVSLRLWLRNLKLNVNEELREKKIIAFVGG